MAKFLVQPKDSWLSAHVVESEDEIDAASWFAHNTTLKAEELVLEIFELKDPVVLRVNVEAHVRGEKGLG